MENQGWTHFTTLFTPVDPYQELEKKLEEYYNLDYEDTIGDLKTRFKYRQVQPNSFSLIYPSSDSDALAVFLRRNPRYRGDPQIYPYSFLRTRVDQWIFFSIYVCLAHM